MYEVKYHPMIKRDLKKVDPHVRDIIKKEHIPIILSNPEIGPELTGDLSGTRSYHFKITKQQFRIAYIIEKVIKTVYIQMIGKRGDFYNILKKRI